MDKIGEQLNSETKPIVNIIKLDSGEKAQSINNYLILPNNTVIEVTDPRNPHQPKYNANIISFSQKHQRGAKFGPTPTGSWKQIDNPDQVDSLLSSLGLQI